MPVAEAIFTIRQATAADLPTIVDMAQLIHLETPYHLHVTVNHDILLGSMRTLMENPMSLVLMATEDGTDKSIGTIGALCHPSPISGEIGVGELFWYVVPDYRSGFGFASPGLRLLRTLEGWAKEMGAKWMQLTASTAEMGQVYSALGYTPIEIDYQKRL